MYDDTFSELLAAMRLLEHVSQPRRYHPEGNALFHSLQVFEHAQKATQDPCLQAAALLHDVGKAFDGDEHAERGAELLDGIACGRVQWLVAHHLDLLRAPRMTRRLLAGDRRLEDLEDLRTWDLAGRRPTASVTSIEWALGTLLEPGVAEGWLSPARLVEDAH